jgi:hypothetical protein
MPSFDIVSQVNSGKIGNAVNPASKKPANRFDFKGTDANSNERNGFEQRKCHMPFKQKDEFKHTLRFFLMGLFLLGMVFVPPSTGYHQGQSFFAVAKASPWHRLGDWPAAWCSLKIVVLSLSGFLMVISLAESLVATGRETLAKLSLLLITAPILVFWMGLYCLVKAIL